MADLSRRQFLSTSAIAATTAVSGPLLAGLKFPFAVENPLTHYPNRGWEKIYRDIFRHDSTFHFLCAPNDTHNCLLKCYVKNGVITRVGPSYGYSKATDLYGTKVSARWEPRICQKGLVLNRRIQGPRRVRYPMVREGFKKWADAGYPRGADGRPDPKYLRRGLESFVRVSWDQAFSYAAKTLHNIATTYAGEKGAALLRKQGLYLPEQISAMQGAGTQVLKFRGGMPLLGITRVFGMYRLANSMALMDAKIRGVKANQAIGARGWDNYSWHTDLPPGHPMVTGQQTVDFDLFDTEHSNLIIAWGMNWIATKMPDSHWLTEARLKGAKVVAVTVEYSSTANKCDEVFVIRPATDGAFALGLAHVMIKEKLFDATHVKTNTDFPFLVRVDNQKLVRAEDAVPGFKPPTMRRDTIVRAKGQGGLPTIKAADKQVIGQGLLDEWGSYVVWDAKAQKPVAVTREDHGKYAVATGVDPALEGTFEVTIKGQTVKVRPVFDLLWQYLRDSCDPETISRITWAPAKAIEGLARQIAANQSKTLIATGMGPNQFFNNDLKDRSLFLVCALTKNIGFHGGNIGSYAGNYRAAYFDGMGTYIAEDPFRLQLEPNKPVNVKQYFKFESVHFWNHGDKPLKIGTKLFTGKSHITTPTKSLMVCNSNSILGNVKGHYDVVVNTLPKMEMLAVNEWWWTGTCEYADIVFAVDSWAELKHPDATASVTNPFLQIFPRTPFKRIHDTRGDIEVQQGVTEKLAEVVGEPRFKDVYKFVRENQTIEYLQRIFNSSTMAKGYDARDLETKAKDGIPALLMSRTYPKIIGYEQANEEKKWYTKSGRLEFYRDEDEWIEHGESLPVYRETIDATQYEPNVIVAKPHPCIKPQPLESYGLKTSDLSGEVRQVRNVVMTIDQLLKSKHPLKDKGFTHVYLTPKYRHGAHTMPVDLAAVAVWFGPFGDIYRRDKRMPWVAEGYVDMNPDDAKALGINDGDYIWVDADPHDRPFHGIDKPENKAAYHMSRLMIRARYNTGIPKSITRSWFNMYGASYGSVEGQAKNKDGLARNPRTGYQAMFRFGSHQSATRSWLRPTQMTESLVRKGTIGPNIGKGFAPDVHCPTGAPRDSFVKFTKAEDGGRNRDNWRPAKLGLRPGYEVDKIKKFLAGGYIE